MGTRGTYVFVYKGIYYVFYNHMDSYPEALGQILVMMIKCDDYDTWGETLVDTIINKNWKIRKLIRNDFGNYKSVPVSEDDIMEDTEWTKTSFMHTGDSKLLLKWDYTCLLKHCEIIKALVQTCCPTLERSDHIVSGHYDSEESVLNVHQQDWTYLIDLDTHKFKVFGGMNDVCFPLSGIPFDWIDKINAKE
jgi:hypothetical protein